MTMTPSASTSRRRLAEIGRDRGDALALDEHVAARQVAEAGMHGDDRCARRRIRFIASGLRPFAAKARAINPRMALAFSGRGFQ